MLSQCTGAFWNAESEPDAAFDFSGKCGNIFVFLVFVGDSASGCPGEKELLSEGSESVCVPADEQPDQYVGFFYDSDLPDAVYDDWRAFLRGECESVHDSGA